MSFTIEINNFKVFEKITLKLPCEGMVLLDGVSGKGKTSVIQSFVFAITGQGKKIASYGTKKVKVAISKYDDENKKEFCIIRQKSPDSLVFEKDNKEYHDDEAQKFIDSIFGRNFNMTSIIFQKGSMSFLTLSPKDKLVYIENILFSDFNLDSKKTKLKKTIKEKEEETLSLQTKIDTLQNILRTKLEQLPSDIFSELKDIDDCESFREEVISKYNSRKKELVVIKNEIQEIINIVNNHENDVKTYNVHKSTINRLEKELAEYDKELKDNYEDYDIKSKEQRVELIINAIKYINLKQRLEKEESQLKNVSTQLRTNIETEIGKLRDSNKEIGEQVSKNILDLEEEYSKIQEAISVKNRIQSIQTKINERKKFLEADDVDTMEKKIAENDANISDLLTKKKQYEVAKTSIKCPCCKVTLRYISSEHKLEKFEMGEYEDSGVSNIEKDLSVLIKTNNDTKQRLATFKKIIDNIETLSKEIISCEKDIPEGFDLELLKLKEISSLKKVELESLREKKNQLIYNNNRLKHLEKHIGEIDNNEHPSIANFIDTIKMLKTSMKAFENNTLRDNDLGQLEIELDEIKISIAQDKSKITKKDRLLAKKKEIMREIENVNSTIEELHILSEEELDNINQKLKLLRIDEQDIESYLSITDIALISREIEKQLSYLKYVAEKNSIEEKISSEKQRHSELSGDLNKHIKLYKCIEISESKLIYKFIDTLNERVNYHLETMFEEPMTVCVSCFKDTKKGEKPQIDFNVYYKGVETDISNLSGGEYDRLNLCFLLAFNELSESNMIILDEALSSLNQELVADIIEHIQECNKDNRKLVLMTLHQSIKGMFDQVIAL